MASIGIPIEAIRSYNCSNYLNFKPIVTFNGV